MNNYMLNFLILIPKVNSNLSAINVKEELQGIHIVYTVACGIHSATLTGREKRTSQWQIFDVHNGLMSAFDRDIGGRRVTLCALAWPRGFCCHS